LNKTKVIKNGGKAPVWNDEIFTFEIRKEESISFTVKDKDLLKSNTVGIFILKLLNAKEMAKF